MNRIADKIAPEASVYDQRDEKKPHGAHLVVAAMLVYSFLVYGQWDARLGVGAAFLIASITYLFAMYLYYGITRLAYQRYTYLLWGGTAAAVITAYLLLGASGLWVVLTGWSMLLFAGALCGRLTLAGHGQGRIYIVGAIAVAGIFALQSLPMWSDFVKAAPQLGEALTEQSEQILTGMGHSSDTIQQSLDQSRKLFDVLVRLFPAVTILAALLQFTVGYLAFVLWVDRTNRSSARYVPFIFWRVPFGFAPVVVMAILMRFFGGDTLATIADNTLVILAMYYCVAGLALMEYYLRKLTVSRMMKVLFYILLFLSQLIGFFVAILLGFVDSFTDWRKVHAQKAS